MMAKVTILKEGYAYIDKEGWMRANASCTVVQTPENIVIVDTLTPWDGQFILEKLDEMGISAEDVTYVVSTHGHSDHNGNNSLFLKAKRHIVGFFVSHQDQYFAHPFEHDEPFIIDEYLKIIATPGHTNEDVSLVVKINAPEAKKLEKHSSSNDAIDSPTTHEEPPVANTNTTTGTGDETLSLQTLVIAGDLFENEKDILKEELWTGNSFQPEVQVRHRHKVLEMAQFVIPGHGSIFRVTSEHRNAAISLFNRYKSKEQ